MPQKKEDCKNCHGYWVFPGEDHYPFCSNGCFTHWQSFENARLERIEKEIEGHMQAIAKLEAEKIRK